MHFGFIGHNQENGSDKIWGYVIIGPYKPAPKYSWMEPTHTCLIFWGARNKAIKVKVSDNRETSKLESSKLHNGYIEITEAKLHEIAPSFANEIETKILVEKLKGTI